MLGAATLGAMPGAAIPGEVRAFGEDLRAFGDKARAFGEEACVFGEPLAQAGLAGSHAGETTDEPRPTVGTGSGAGFA